MKSVLASSGFLTKAFKVYWKESTFSGDFQPRLSVACAGSSCSGVSIDRCVIRRRSMRRYWLRRSAVVDFNETDAGAVVHSREQRGVKARR